MFDRLRSYGKEAGADEVWSDPEALEEDSFSYLLASTVGLLAHEVDGMALVLAG